MNIPQVTIKKDNNLFYNKVKHEVRIVDQKNITSFKETHMILDSKKGSEIVRVHKARENSIWINHEILQMMKIRDKLYKVDKKDESQINCSEINNQQTDNPDCISNGLNKYFSKVEESIVEELNRDISVMRPNGIPVCNEINSRNNIDIELSDCNEIKEIILDLKKV